MSRGVSLIFFVLFLFGSSLDGLFGQGLIIPGAGSINRAMGGASVAAPVDAAGACYWNPAAISALENNEFFFSAELLISDINLASSVPQTGLSGEDSSDGGVAVAPTIAFVQHLENSPVTFGLGVFALLGGSVNFPGSSTNPLLTPYDPPNTFGFGPIHADAAGLQIDPIISYRITEQIAIGGGVMINQVSLDLDPAFFGPRNSNGTFPAATHGRPYWGAGFQVGLFAELSPTWNFGISYKSEQWFETLKWNSKDEIGAALDLELELSLPDILSAGVGYMGDRFTAAVDVRYFNYDGTTLFGDPLSEGGLGWESIFAVAVGAQFQINNALAVQVGYEGNENPIPDVSTLFNVQLPGIGKHVLSGGLTMRLAENLTSSVSLIRHFENSITSPILLVPGSSVTLRSALTSLAFGTSLSF